MVVTNDNIGDIICRYDTGERFAVKEVTGDGLSIQYEDGSYGCLASNVVFGGIERDEARIASFRTNLSLSRVLTAAEEAAGRRLNFGQCGVIEQQNAFRVTEVVKEQRDHFRSRLLSERQTLKAGRALADQFLSDLTQQGTGSTARFFDISVQYCGSTDHPVFRMNATVDLDRQAAMVSLGNQTISSSIPVKSLDALLKSATDRAIQQHHDPHASSICIDR